MGIEIRRVPKDWERPKCNYECGCKISDIARYHPLHDAEYNIAAKEWMNNLLLWREGKLAERHGHSICKYYWEYAGNPPDANYYRSKDDGTDFQSPPDMFQVYEIVTKGTPISPKFETLEEMRQWLIEKGYSEKVDSLFIKRVSAPSLLTFKDEERKVQILENIEALSFSKDDGISHEK